MPTFKILTRNTVLTLAAALPLAACGDNLTPTTYHGVPYTDERTAGTGIAYVRASMLPPKETKTETIMEQKTVVKSTATTTQTPPPPVADEPAPPLTAGDKVFDKKQSK